MVPKSEWPCWEIMKCEGSENCPARQRPDENCWDIAAEIDDYRRAFNICKDCIVYLLKADNSVLSKQEMQIILEQKSTCTLAQEMI
ncbi:MAG: hypothetical protein JRF02_01400 [Deltaproteobacteria bacterium]|jgi:hypothetical protein|nr:hypothetical protein [Deltaproteobacteria bacterium]